MGQADWRLLFVTHTEVVIDPQAAIESWPLSDVGRKRMNRFADALSGAGVTAVWSSAERKAVDGAQILAGRLGITPRVDAGLGENDRSATGYIAPPEFWDVVREFFARPDESVRGWESARAAQRRIVAAVDRVLAAEPAGRIVVVSHGGVARLLSAHLEGCAIGEEDRPTHPGGGSCRLLGGEPLRPLGPWRDIEAFGDVGIGRTRSS
ncbi:histidine phosphatase family protein [Phenylobacterium sp.]|jgi:broad specificity phosphatase PhoE|uniref:histidine phosphatase family protein n=1 Tax=Phenylobacterium sp. TaxID=1871053 RepID=UPI002E2F20CB|nr:histidine phosphatase family protein [Phenylobacterium sp.]HEX2561131.1 histidine phosphatase family protein [Phenylobacterium sp.]